MLIYGQRGIAVRQVQAGHRLHVQAVHPAAAGVHHQVHQVAGHQVAVHDRHHPAVDRQVRRQVQVRVVRQAAALRALTHKEGCDAVI